MVKQGQFAGVSSAKRLKNFKQQAKATEAKAITPEKVGEFLLVRYHLTQNTRLAPLMKETMQRVLMTLLDNATGTTWSLDKLFVTTLGQIANQVPWQFYALLATEWPRTQKFLNKEVPAVPLNERIIVTDDVTDVPEKIAQQLAINWFLMMFATMPERLAAVTEQQVADTKQSFLQDGAINWANVATVYSTTPFIMPDDVDEATKTWLTDLQALAIEQLH